jgi:TolA-binding protein
MRRAKVQFVRRLPILCLLLIVLPILPVRAQSSPSEERAYEAALKSFSDELWGRAEQEWRDFTIRFPLSEKSSQAVLYQARSLVELERYSAAVQLLLDTLPQSAALRDEYLFWIAESHFRAGQGTAAAEAFAQVVREFPQSSRALEALLGQAAARASLEQWDEVISVLDNPAGLLKTAPRSSENHLFLARGWLLLAEALLASGNFQEAETILGSTELDQLNEALEWEKRRLLAEASLAAKRYDDALVASSNLVVAAAASGLRSHVADAILFQGLVQEAMQDVDGAIAAYRQNLTTNTPPSVQRRTLLRLSNLLIEHDRLQAARGVIEQFLGVATDQETMDLARLTLAELKLRQHMKPRVPSGDGEGQVAPTNLLEQAIATLDEVIQSAPSRTVRGKAYLYRGWAEWLQGRYTDSLAGFQQATELLPQSEELMVAYFKLADSQFQLEQFEAARENYLQVADSAPVVGGGALDLIESALYQALRASLELQRPDLASSDLGRLLEAYPHGFYASTSVLLTGQEINEGGDPVAARALFEEFLKQAPDSDRLPEIQLAIARTYESEANWSDAIQVYDALLELSNAAPVAAQAEYFKAMDTALLGQEAAALSQFTNFVVRYPTDELAPRAQWWIGDHYWRRQDFANAELNFQLLFQTWPNAADHLAYEAHMMAGRAAMERARPEDAIPYFTNLTSDLKCPPDLKPKAMFAYGDALMKVGSTATNDPYANYASAIKVFSSIERNYPSNELAAPAVGRVGDCYLVLGGSDPRAFLSASNAYQRAMLSPTAGVSTRSLAEIGMATVFEAQARKLDKPAATPMLEKALNHYLNVFYAKNLREEESPDVFLVKRSGLEAGRIAETLGLWRQARRIYERLIDLIPVMQQPLENKILKLSQQEPERPE